MRKGFLVLIVLAISVMLCKVASANLIVNGGFETGNFSGWTTTPATSGSAFGVGGGPHTGIFAALFGAEFPPFMDSISQTLTTVPGQSYTIDYWLKNDECNSVEQCTPLNRFLVQWGVTTLSDTVNLTAFGYTEFKFTELAAGPSTVLSFSSYNVPSFFRLDDVSVNTVIPEPSCLTLLGIGLVGLVGFRWRRRYGHP